MKRIKTVIGLAGLSSLIGPLPATAATYNIYFNNAEQGANSKASPTVIVGPPQPQASSEPSPGSEPSVQPAPMQSAPVTSPTPNPALTPEVSNPREEYIFNPYDHGRYPAFRVMVGGAYNSIHSSTTSTSLNSDPFSSQPFLTQNNDSTTTKTTPSFEASYFWYPNLGASLIVSDLSGFELTFVPFGMPGGHFIQPEISLGLLASLSDVNFGGGPEVGAKIAFNFTHSVALVVGARASIVRDSSYNFVQGNAALAYNF